MVVALLSIAIGATILSGLVSIYYDVPKQMGAQFRNYGANMIFTASGDSFTMADVEAAKAAAAAAPVAAAVGAVAADAIPVENKKAYRQVEDETIYMSKEELDAKLKAEAEAIAAAKTPVELPDDKAAKKKAAKKEKKKVEVEYEDVESGSKFLTVLAVIIALILIILLAVILVLQIAPDSGVAAWIDSLIESITSKVSLIEATDGQFLL